MLVHKAALAAAIAVLVVLSAGVSSASAAPPGNDLSSGATVVSSGFTETLDTTEATTDAQDEQANANCHAPATDASVWYTYTPESDLGTRVDVSFSSYSAGVIVATGSPGSLSVVTCGPNTVSFDAEAGTTYYILAFDDQFDGGGNGGSLAFSLTSFAAPIADVTVDPTGTVDTKTGVATVTGTITCSDADSVAIWTSLEQHLGPRATITGEGFFFGEASTCDGTAQRWTSEVVPRDGKFAGGKTASFTYAFACGELTCANDYVEQEVKLRGIRQ